MWRQWNIFQRQQYGRERQSLLLELSNGVEEPSLSELLRKSSGDVVFNYVFSFLREMRIMGMIIFF